MTWRKGESGNPAGRPKGCRNRLTERFLEVLVLDFEQHGHQAVIALREQDPGTYLRIVGAIVSRLIVRDGEQGEPLDRPEDYAE